MHFYDFIQLNETEQIEILWYNGEQIGRRKDEEHLILLYQVEGFYVEVFYHNKERVIKKYMSFECTDLLEPYLEKIDITTVYKQIKKQSKAIDQAMLQSAINRNTDTASQSSQKNDEQKQKFNLWNKIKTIFTDKK